MWKKNLRTLSSILLQRQSRASTNSSSILYIQISRYKYNSFLYSKLFTNFYSSYQIKQSSFPLPFQNPRVHFDFSSVADKAARCWNCNAGASSTTPFLFCDACRSIQPVDHSIDYFQIFGVEKKYEIEEGKLEGKYKDWQKKLHPDLVHSKSKEEREYAAEQSARVTNAYRTLTNPLSRAIYILKLEGVDIDEEARITDPELLSEIMEIREAVEESGDSEKLNEIQEQMQKKMGDWSKSFADAFHGRKYDEAVASIQRMTYYTRAIEEIVKKL